MKPTKANILLVEDDINLGFVIKDNLEEAGFEVTHCTDGQAAIQIFENQHFDLCVLDVMLPLKDGFTLATEIRKKNSLVPLLFLSAKALKEDKLQGFRVGADDYITKPFSIEELIMRIGVFLRRSTTPPPPTQASEPITIFQLGEYKLEYENLTLLHASETVRLTQREADLLRMFCLHQGQILRRDHILKALWGSDDYFNGRSLDVFISKLRKHLKCDETIEISNHHGVGFRLEIKHNH